MPILRIPVPLDVNMGLFFPRDVSRATLGYHSTWSNSIDPWVIKRREWLDAFTPDYRIVLISVFQLEGDFVSSVDIKFNQANDVILFKLRWPAECWAAE